MSNSQQLLLTTDFNSLINWSVSFILETNIEYNPKYKLYRIGDFLHKCQSPLTVQADQQYKRIKVKINGNGVELRDITKGSQIGTKKQNEVSAGQFIMSKIDARNGAFGIIPEELHGAIATNDFPIFTINTNIINPDFFIRITSTSQFIKFAKSCSSGTTNRQRIDINKFLDVKIPLPDIREQNEIIKNYNKLTDQIELNKAKVKTLKKQINTFIYSSLGIKDFQPKESNKLLRFSDYCSISNWKPSVFDSQNWISSSKYEITSLNTSNTEFIIRGKSPQYSTNSNSIILNQKCNRLNEITLDYAKTVNSTWLNQFDDNILTQQNDLLINSTGEGTIGRASWIPEIYSGLLYDSHLLLVRPIETKINGYFLTELFNTKFIQLQIDLIKSAKSTKQTELGVANLKKIKFPLPPVDVQYEIAKEIKELKSKKQKLDQEIIYLYSKAKDYVNNTLFAK